MAHYTEYRISECLKWLHDAVKTAVPDVFAGSRPTVTGEQLGTFAVVEISGGLTDRNPWQKGMVDITVFVKSKAGGIEDVEGMDEAVSKIVKLFPIVRGRYSATRPNILLKGVDATGFGVCVIQASLLINTTDAYRY